jgi:hypothetical protein
MPAGTPALLEAAEAREIAGIFVSGILELSFQKSIRGENGLLNARVALNRQYATVGKPSATWEFWN